MGGLAPQSTVSSCSGDMKVPCAKELPHLQENHPEKWGAEWEALGAGSIPSAWLPVLQAAEACFLPCKMCSPEPPQARHLPFLSFFLRSQRSHCFLVKRTQQKQQCPLS